MTISSKFILSLVCLLVFACGKADQSDFSQTDSLVGGHIVNSCNDVPAKKSSYSHCLLMNPALPGDSPANQIYIELVDGKDDQGHTVSFESKDYRMLIDAMRYLQNHWAVHAKEKAVLIDQGSEEQTGFEACIQRNSSKDFLPKNSIATNFATTEKQQVAWAVTSLQLLFDKQAKNNSINYITAYTELGTSSLAHAYIGRDEPNFGDLNIGFNVSLIQSQSIPYLAGALMHEWLHRKGWTHDSGYEGTLINALTLCVAKGNNTKPSGLGLREDILVID